MRAAALLCIAFAASAAAPRHASAQTVDEFPWKQRLWYPLRDVNTAEYEPDFAWQRISETERQRTSGVDFWYGSLSERRLGVEQRLQLNVPLAGERLRFRWQHESTATEEIEAEHEKIELQIGLARGLALTISGRGVLEKAQASFGAGALWTSSDRTRYVDLTLQHDAAVHDARTPYDAKDRAPPLRVLGETNLERGAWRLYGFADWQLEGRRVYEAPRGSGGVRDRRAYERRTELKVEWAASADTGLGVRHRFTGVGDERRHFAGYVDPEKDLLDYDFDRTHHRADLFGEHRFAPFRVRAIAGWWVQDDAADFSLGADYGYRRTQFLYGSRAHWKITPYSEVGVGYWGSIMTAVRRDAGGPLRTRELGHRRERHEGFYVDKADVVVAYAFDRTLRLEFVLSQEVTRGEFGGGSGKALLLF